MTGMFNQTSGSSITRFVFETHFRQTVLQPAAIQPQICIISQESAMKSFQKHHLDSIWTSGQFYMNSCGGYYKRETQLF